jgi:hypothetical protein
MMTQATILIVEDNDDDAALLRRAFTGAKVLNLRSADEAFRKSNYCGCPRGR